MTSLNFHQDIVEGKINEVMIRNKVMGAIIRALLLTSLTIDVKVTSLLPIFTLRPDVITDDVHVTDKDQISTNFLKI